MSKKIFISEREIKEAAVNLANEIQKSNWKPDLIVAVTRGGLIPAGYISYYLNVSNVDVFNVWSYSGEEQKVELFDDQEYQLHVDIQNLVKKWIPRNILIVDDLIDTGNTLQFVDQGMMAVYNYLKMIGKNREYDWRFGVLYTVPESASKLSKEVFAGKQKPEGWLVFPWDTKE